MTSNPNIEPQGRVSGELPAWPAEDSDDTPQEFEAYVPPQPRESQFEPNTRITEPSVPEKKSQKKKIAIISGIAGVAMAAGTALGLSLNKDKDNTQGPQLPPQPTSSAPEVPGTTTSAASVSETETSQEDVPGSERIITKDKEGNVLDLTAKEFVDKYKATIDKFDDRGDMNPETKIALSQDVMTQKLEVLAMLMGANVGADEAFSKNAKPGQGDAQLAESEDAISYALEQLGITGTTDQKSIAAEGKFTTLEKWIIQENRNGIVAARNGKAGAPKITVTEYTNSVPTPDSDTKGMYLDADLEYLKADGSKQKLELGSGLTTSMSGVRHDAPDGAWKAQINLKGIKGY